MSSLPCTGTGHDRPVPVHPAESPTNNSSICLTGPRPSGLADDLRMPAPVIGRGDTMRIARRGLLLVVVVLALSAGCGRGMKPNPVAEQLGTTTRTTERYHVLSERPFETALRWDGCVAALAQITNAIAYPADV